MSLRNIVPLVAMVDQKDGEAIDGCDRIIEDIGEIPMPAPKPILVRNIITSLTLISALTIINVALIVLGENIGIEQNTITFDIIALILSILIAFFSLIFYGSIMEYFNKEPGVITMAIAYVIPAVLAYYSGLFRDNVHTVIIIVLFVLVLAYMLVASPKER